MVLFPDFSSERYWYIGTAWSLGVEIQFYLFAPFLFILMKNRFSALILLILSSLVSIFGLYFEWQLVNVESLLKYLPYFILGGIIYVWNLNVSYKIAKLSMLITFSLLILSHIIPDFRDVFLSRDYMVLGFVLRESFNIVLTLTSLPFIIYNIHQTILNKKNDAIASSMSYVVYLLHWPILQLYSYSVIGVDIPQKFVHLLLYFVFTLVFSFLISKYFDRNFENKRREWIKKKELNYSIVS